MQALHNAQHTFGYIPAEIRISSQELRIPMSEIYGGHVLLRFTLEPRGKCQVGVCLGTACYVKVPASFWNRSNKTQSEKQHHLGGR